MIIPLLLVDGEKIVDTTALVDTRATETFIDRRFAERLAIPLLEIDKPIIVKNANGTRNQEGLITHYTWIKTRIKGYNRVERYLVTSLGKDTIILGLPWLKQVNPIINFAQGTININPRKVKWMLGRKFREKIDI